MNFDSAFDLLITHEGGFSNRPLSDDPGGATMYGVTEKVARANGYTGAMQDFQLNTAKDIYRRQYWDACKCDQMPEAVRYPLFDAAVNSGAGQSIKWLQSSVGVKADGVIGPMTLASVAAADADRLAKQMLGRRLSFLTGLSNWQANARGWSRRVASILQM